MSQSNDLANTLIIALKDRDIPFNCAEIKSAFTDEKEATENETWVMEHLNHHTLLSQEELTLYTNLESTGSLQNIINNLDTNADRPFLDEDLRKAINSLNASTAVIQKQRRVLASQCDNIDKELRRKAEREVRRNTGIEHLRQRYNSERQRTSAGSTELAQEVRAVLKIESENTAADSKRILSTLAAWLKEDDRALADLERLGSGIGPTGDDASVVKRTSELSTILAHYLAEEIQYRLDRVYLENLRVGQTKASQNLDGVADEVSIALERELESLYPEIDMLAEMYTKQQYNAPISRALQKHHDQLHISSFQKFNYILDLVAGMTLSTERLTKSLQDRESFCGTLETFNTTYRTKVGNQFSEISVPRREDFRRRSIQPTLAYTPSAKRIDSVSESHALAAVLRRTGLSSESVFHPEDDNAGIDVLFDARHHMFDCLQNYGIAADAPLVTELISSDQTTRLLSSSLNVYDYMQHLRELNTGGGDSYFVEAKSKDKGKAKGMKLEDALRQVTLDDARSEYGPVSSSLLLQRSSNSSSKQLSGVPPMVAGTSISTASSPGKPISPHTPHTPAIPSRLSSNSIVDYTHSEGNGTELSQGHGSPLDENTSDGTTMEHGPSAVNAIDIPTSPRLFPPVYRRSSSAAHRPRTVAVDDDEIFPFNRSVSLGAEERSNLSLGALHRQHEYESSDTATHRAQREPRPMSSNEDAVVPPSSITRGQGSHKGVTPGPTVASSSSSHHHVYQPRFSHSRGRGSSGGHHSLSSGSSSLARGAAITPGLAERESERDGNGSGSNSVTSAMEDRRGVGRRPSAGRGGPPQSAQLEEDEPLLFAMSDFGASRRSFEEGKHVNHAHDPTGNIAGSRRGGSSRRGGGFHAWS